MGVVSLRWEGFLEKVSFEHCGLEFRVKRIGIIIMDLT